jgi:hypothetical protein
VKIVPVIGDMLDGRHAPAEDKCCVFSVLPIS